jgi:ABC-type multidrug transport system ATPase subunit
VSDEGSGVSREPAGQATVATASLVARRGRVALSAISAEWGPGAHAILGTADDGGPLLLSVIAGRVAPRSGRARVLGEDPRHRSVRPRVAHVPMEVALPDALRVDEALALAATLRGEPARDAVARLAPLGIEALAQRAVRSLPLAEARAVALAEALTSEAVRVVLVEEPFAAMDARAAGRVANLLRARADAGVVVVVATASVGDAADVADDHLLLRRGAVVRRGGSDDALVGFWHDGDQARLRVVMRDAEDGRALAAALARQPEVLGVERLVGAVCARGRDAEPLAQAAARAAIEAGVDVTELRFDPPSLDEARALPGPTEPP